MPGDEMGLDPDLDRDFTPDEARRALRADDAATDAGTPARDLGIETSADAHTSSGGNGTGTQPT